MAWPMLDGGVYLGVFDGHGADGHLVASFVSERLADLLRSSRDLSQQLVETNEQLRTAAVPSEFSGTTAIVALLGHRQVTVACVGDSRCVLGSAPVLLPAAHPGWRREAGAWLAAGGLRGLLGGARRAGWSARALSQEQTCALTSERERIQQSGGLVMAVEDGRAERVWSCDADGRRTEGGLVMTRAMGHHASWAEAAGVIATPIVTEVALCAADRCLILASDGVWDVLSSAEVVALCEKNHPHGRAACRAIVRRAKSRWAARAKGQGRDDVTAIVAYLPLNLNLPPGVSTRLGSGFGSGASEACTGCEVAHVAREVELEVPSEELAGGDSHPGSVALAAAPYEYKR